MFVNRLPAILAAALLAGSASSALTANTAHQPAPISLETLKSATQTMSTDAFEGRAPTTAGEEKTVAFIAEQFRKAGLKPGNKGSWYQNVPLVENTASPSQMTISGGSTPIGPSPAAR